MRRYVHTYIHTYKQYIETDIPTKLCIAVLHISTNLNKLTYISECIHAYIQPDKQTDKHTNKHTCRQTYRQTYKHAYITTYRLTYIPAYVHTCLHYYDIYMYISPNQHTYIPPISIHPYVRPSRPVTLSINTYTSLWLYETSDVPEPIIEARKASKHLAGGRDAAANIVVIGAESLTNEFGIQGFIV